MKIMIIALTSTIAVMKNKVLTLQTIIKTAVLKKMLQLRIILLLKHGLTFMTL